MDGMKEGLFLVWCLTKVVLILNRLIVKTATCKQHVSI